MEGGCTLELMGSRLFSQENKNPFGAGSWHTEQWGALPGNQNPFLWLMCEESKFLYHLVKGFLSSKYNNHFNIVISHYETNLLSPVQFAGWEKGTEYSAEIRTEQTTDQCFTQSKAARTNKQSKDRWTQSVKQDQDLWPDILEKIQIHCLFGCLNILQSSIFLSHLLHQKSFFCSHWSF